MLLRVVDARAFQRAVKYVALLSSAALCGCLAGCGDRMRPPSPAQLIEFEQAGPSGPAVDMERLAQARLEQRAYRVVPGDVLAVRIPRILTPDSRRAEITAEGTEAYTCRISDEGTIVLPVIGAMGVSGRSLAEVEASVRSAYYPKFITTQPPVYVSVLEYDTRRVSIVGAVAKPGVYGLRHDQMSLVYLLMEAGGIEQGGARLIRIDRAGQGNARGPARSFSASGRSGSSQVNLPPPDAWRPDDAPDASAPRAVFRLEGPLNTTGWLTIEQGDDILARRWLDIANQPQRQRFLTLAADASPWIAATDLSTRLSQLGGFLESRVQGYDERDVRQRAGWEMTDDHRFISSLPGRASSAAQPLAKAVGEPAGAMRDDAERLTLPVRGLNIPFADVVLEEGDSVIVERPEEQYVTVIGLVNRAGNFPYPVNARYTLIQALGLAGGLDLTADPRYVSVYRLQLDGRIVSATFRLIDPGDQEQLTEALALPMKPGDIVSVEHTLRTRTNVFFDRIFRISLGLYLNPDTLWQR